MCLSLCTWQRSSPEHLYPSLKPYVLFVFEVYLVDQLVMELFSIGARRLSGEAVVGMRQGAWCDRETLSCMTPCRIKLASEGLGPRKVFCSVVFLVCSAFSRYGIKKWAFFCSVVQFFQTVFVYQLEFREFFTVPLSFWNKIGYIVWINTFIPRC